jgi:hypothetical protein
MQAFKKWKNPIRGKRGRGQKNQTRSKMFREEATRLIVCGTLFNQTLVEKERGNRSLL